MACHGHTHSRSASLPELTLDSERACARLPVAR